MKKAAIALLALSLLFCLASCKEDEQAWEKSSDTAAEENTGNETSGSEESNDPASEETTSSAVWSPVV